MYFEGLVYESLAVPVAVAVIFSFRNWPMMTTGSDQERFFKPCNISFNKEILLQILSRNAGYEFEIFLGLSTI